MTITVELDEDVKARLIEESLQSGESVDVIASRILGQTLRDQSQVSKPFQVRSFKLEMPEKWKHLTPSEILDEMDIEEYEEKLERTRRQPLALRA